MKKTSGYRKAILAGALMLIAGAGYSQAAYQKIWIFGNNAGLDFSSGSPVPFLTDMYAQEGVATQCDASGQLLFYTNKNIVWDRNHNIMPNGADLDMADTSTSTTQGAVIIPWPGNNDKYFLFSLSVVAGGCTEPYMSCGYLSYSVVDMSLNGGLGDVLAAQKAILIDSLLGEQMIGIRGDCNGYWLIVHNKNDINFKSYHIDADGLNTTPVISSVSSLGYYYIQSQGSFAYAPGTRKIAAAFRNVFEIAGIRHVVELFDFDPATGVVSNPQLLDSNAAHPYGVCFSPDETKLYYTDHELHQFDLSLPTLDEIRASNTLLSTDFCGALKTGPDDKIYVARPLLDGHISFINNPNMAGTACEYNADAIALLPGSNCVLGLPNEMFLPANSSDTGTASHTHNHIICEGKSLTLHAPVTGSSYVWNDGSTADSIVVTAAGTYWVSSNEPCLSRTDTFIVAPLNLRVFLGNDTVICEGDELLLSAPDIEGAVLLWQDGSTATVYTVKQAGIYTLKITADGCEAEDELKVSVQNCHCRPGMPTAFSPNSDGINDTYKPEFPGDCPIKDYTFGIFNRWGEQIFSTRDLNQGWDGLYRSQKADAGVYFYFLSYYNYGDMGYRYIKGDLTLIR